MPDQPKRQPAPIEFLTDERIAELERPVRPGDLLIAPGIPGAPKLGWSEVPGFPSQHYKIADGDEVLGFEGVICRTRPRSDDG